MTLLLHNINNKTNQEEISQQHPPPMRQTNPNRSFGGQQIVGKRSNGQDCICICNKHLNEWIREIERIRSSWRPPWLLKRKCRKKPRLGNKERVAETRSTGLVGFYTCEDGNINPNLQFCLPFLLPPSFDKQLQRSPHWPLGTWMDLNSLIIQRFWSVKNWVGSLFRARKINRLGSTKNLD